MDVMTWASREAKGKLAETLPRRWAHVQGVARRATVAARLFGRADRVDLVSAAMVHDIGYAPHLVDTGFHSIDSARYLERVGFPRRIVNLVANHSCASEEAELRGLSTELFAFPDEQTPLRNALWWADMTTTPDGEVTTFAERLEEIQDRYGPDDVVSVFVRQAENDLFEAVERTEFLLRDAGINYE